MLADHAGYERPGVEADPDRKSRHAGSLPLPGRFRHALADCHRKQRGVEGVGGVRGGNAAGCHIGVTDRLELFHLASGRQRVEPPEVFFQAVDQLVGLHGLGHPREADEVGEQDRDCVEVPRLALPRAGEFVGDLSRKHAVEQVLGLLQALPELLAGGGELGVHLLQFGVLTEDVFVGGEEQVEELSPADVELHRLAGVFQRQRFAGRIRGGQVAEQVIDPLEHVRRIVGLGDVGGSPFTQPVENVGRGGERREHEHWYVPQVGIGLENSTEFVPVHLGHFDVGDHKHGPMLADQGQGLGAVGSPVDQIPGRFQGSLEDPPLETAVLGDHDCQWCIHGPEDSRNAGC